MTSRDGSGGTPSARSNAFPTPNSMQAQQSPMVTAGNPTGLPVSPVSLDPTGPKPGDLHDRNGTQNTLQETKAAQQSTRSPVLAPASRSGVNKGDVLLKQYDTVCKEDGIVDTLAEYEDDDDDERYDERGHKQRRQADAKWRRSSRKGPTASAQNLHDCTASDDFSPTERFEEGDEEHEQDRHGRGGRSSSRKGEDDEEAGSDASDERTTYLPLRRWVKKMDPLFMTILKWALAGLLLCFLGFVVFGILYSGIAYHGDKYISCEHDNGDSQGSGGNGTNGNTNDNLGTGKCDTAYGTILGAHDGVFGYSNCNSDFISEDDSYTPVYTLSSSAVTKATGASPPPVVPENLYTGLRWQCVEYARRYWILRGKPEPAYFGSVDGASDIWEETKVWSVYNQSRTMRLLRFPNGGSVMAGVQAPEVGDIIIYAKDRTGDFPFGHVAVIVGVAQTEVFVAEQNWDSHVWPGPFHNYSRRIPLRWEPSTLSYTMKDTDGTILGWMRYR